MTDNGGGLLRPAGDGDAAAIGELVTREMPWIQGQVRRRLGTLLRGKGQTEDYAQSCLVQILRYGPRLPLHDRAQFRALCGRIIENRLRDKVDWLRAKKREIARERPLPEDSVLRLDPTYSSVPTPSKLADREEHIRWVRLALDVLAPKDHDVILLRDWEGLSFTEVGDRLGVKEDAARMRYKRAVDRLRDVIVRLQRGEIEAAATAAEPKELSA